MPRANTRASSASLNRLHRLVARALEKELKAAAYSDEPVPAALIGKAIDFLKLTGTDSPELDNKPLAALHATLPSFSDEE